MNVKEFEKKEKSTAEITVEVSPEEFDAAIQRAYLKKRGHISIPGFRKGKASRKMIESMYGVGVFYEDAVEDVAPAALDAALKEKSLETVGRPSILDFNIGEDKSLTIKFLVSLYPKVTLREYRGIAAPKAAVRVTKKDVEHEIAHVRERNARVEIVERGAENGDIVNIDFEGFIDGVAFQGGKGENHDLELGSGDFIPGFEEQLVGAVAGADVEVNVTFPQAYVQDLAGKKATFKVHVNDVKSKELPELDDEFAKDVSEFDTFEEYAANVKEEITERRRQESQRAFEEAVMERLLDNVEVEIPDAMVEEEVDRILQDYRYKLASQGMELKEYLSMMGMDEKAFRAEMHSTAEKQITRDLALEYIAMNEDFPVSEEDVEKEYGHIADEYKMKVEDVKRAVTAESVKTGLKIEQARKLVLDTAVAEKKEKKADKTENEAAE